MPPPQTSDAETERFLLFSAVTGLLRDVCAVVPVCLVLDDFQWADAQSVALMKHLVRTVDQGALLVIVTYRDSDLTRDHPLTGALADLRRIDGVERLPLDGLGANEVAEVMSAAAGHELDARGIALAGEVAAETGGNPFFVNEILRHLTESGALTFDDETSRWLLAGSKAVGLPESVREVIDRRVERLGDQAREVLTVGAVIGRSFDLELLAPLVDVGESRLLDLLDIAVSASVLVESADQVGRFSFAHALINEALYAALEQRGEPEYMSASRSRSRSCAARIRASASASWRVTGRRPPGQRRPTKRLSMRAVPVCKRWSGSCPTKPSSGLVRHCSCSRPNLTPTQRCGVSC